MDSLTELQQCVDQLGELFYNSIGFLQQNAPSPSTLAALQSLPPQTEEHIRFFVSQIISISKTINTLIDGLPVPEETENEEIELIKRLEEENSMLGDQILKMTAQAEATLKAVREVLQILAKDRTVTADSISQYL